jgi:hypothetical protein
VLIAATIFKAINGKAGDVSLRKSLFSWTAMTFAVAGWLSSRNKVELMLVPTAPTNVRTAHTQQSTAVTVDGGFRTAFRAVRIPTGMPAIKPIAILARRAKRAKRATLIWLFILDSRLALLLYPSLCWAQGPCLLLNSCNECGA